MVGGINDTLAAATSAAARTNLSEAVQVKVLDAAIEEAPRSILSLLEGLGQKIDVSA